MEGILAPAGRRRLTISKSSLTSFSLSPRYFELKLDAETLKKHVPHSVATALANIVLPVPGGPTIKTPYKNIWSMPFLTAIHHDAASKLNYSAV